MAPEKEESPPLAESPPVLRHALAVPVNRGGELDKPIYCGDGASEVQRFHPEK
jgi:hypothetical protein